MKRLNLLGLFVILALSFTSCKKETYTPTTYTYESSSFFDGEVIKISKDNFDGSVNDFRTEVWYYENSNWKLMPITSGAGGANVNVSSGDISVRLNLPPSEILIPIKIVLTR